MGYRMKTVIRTGAGIHFERLALLQPGCNRSLLLLDGALYERDINSFLNGLVPVVLELLLNGLAFGKQHNA
ncbi:hypothetical protein D3C80_1918770 [compost metagenome]